MKNDKVLLYIELPPPMHGMTYINSIIYKNLKKSDNFLFFDTNFTLHVNEVSRVSFRKIFHNISIMLKAWRAFFAAKPTKVYSLLSATKFGIIRDFAILLPVLLFQKRLFLHLHGFTFYKVYENSKLYRFVFDTVSSKAELIVLCEKQKKLTLEVMKKESIVLPNCIKKSVVIKKKKRDKKLKVCYISNISKQKGTFALVKAVKDMNDVDLTIAGNFLDDKEEFLKLVGKCDNVEYVGFANEEKKDEMLQNCDVFCLPSKLEEGSPISIIEAMSYALPIIATDKGCIADMIEGAGCVLPSDYSLADIKDAFKEVEKNYDDYYNRALELFDENYSPERFMVNLKNILKEGETNNVQK